MDWDIFEQPDNKKNDFEQPARWCTKIHLSMPQLGNITAIIALDDRKIDIKFNISQEKPLIY